MQGGEILQTLAQLAIGVLGFSGVVAVLGRRSEGEWTIVDRFRFFWMVRTAALVLIFSLLPFLFHHGGVLGHLLWGWCSALAAIAWISDLAVEFRSDRPPVPWRDSGVNRPALVYVVLAAFGTPLLFGLNALAIAFDRTFAPYLAGLLLSFGVPLILFIRLLYSAAGISRAA